MRHWKVSIAVLTAALMGFGVACDRGSSSDDKKKKKSPDKSAKAKTPDESKAKKKKGSGELPFEATGTVAKVDGKEISADEYNKLVEQRYSGSRRRMPHRMAKRFKEQTLKQAIDQRLIEKELEKADMSVSDKELKKEFEKFKERFPNDKAFQSFLKFRNTSKDQIREQMRKDLALRKLLKEKKGIEITEKEAKEYYDSNPDEFKEPEKVKARHILIDAKENAPEKEVEKARKKAEKLAKKAKKDGTDFAKLAKKKSEGPSAKKGGDLGFFSKERMVPPFSEKAFSMKNGEVSDPVRTRFGFHIIKREDHKEASKKSFEEAKSSIIDKLEKKRLKDAMKGFLEKLRGDAEIQKMTKNIKINVPKQKGSKKAKGLKGLGNIGGGKNLKLKMKGLKKGGSKGGEESSESSSSESGESGSEGSNN